MAVSQVSTEETKNHDSLTTKIITKLEVTEPSQTANTSNNNKFQENQGNNFLVHKEDKEVEAERDQEKKLNHGLQ